MTEKQQVKWQKQASRASRGGAPLAVCQLEVFAVLMLDRRTERKAGKPVPSPAEIHGAARELAGPDEASPKRPVSSVGNE